MKNINRQQERKTVNQLSLFLAAHDDDLAPVDSPYLEVYGVKLKKINVVSK